MKRRLSDFLIEQLYLDELDPVLKEQLVSDREVVRRLEELRRSNEEILEEYPPALMAGQMMGRLEPIEAAEVGQTKPAPSAVTRRTLGEMLRGAVQWRGFYPVLAAAAVLALVVGLLPVVTHNGVMGDTEIRLKGAGPVIHVYRETTGGVELLGNGATARAHDLLQLAYIAAGAKFGVIFSIDGSGTVTLHFPESSRLAARLNNTGEVALPYSYELDNAPSFEHFYFVTSMREFPVEEILRVARQAATSGHNLALPPGFQVAGLTVNKGTKK